MLRFRPHSRWLSFVGVATLSYLAGAAAIFYGLPSSDFLERAFLGARAWSERRHAPTPSQSPGTPAWASDVQRIDEPAKTFDGFTLYACADNEGEGADAYLIDMNGQPVYRWSVPQWRLRLYQPSLTGQPRKVHNFKPCFYGLQLESNGDLLVVSHGAPPVAGSSLMKLDKDSQIIWQYPAPIHHDVAVDERGTIYAVQAELLTELPAGLEKVPTPCLSDQLVLLSPDGTPLREPISLLAALRNSPFALLLESPGGERESGESDLLHTNFVQVLSPALTTKFPAFKAGQVLVSMRNLNTIGVLDLDTSSFVWAATGPWRAQHDAQFLDNGHLLLFDNRGDSAGSRVLEYDPQTQAFPWSYAGRGDRTFYSSERGMSQRLPNGNTLIVDSEEGKIMEVSRERQLVWSRSLGRFITTARRYAAEELTFLGDRHARP